MAEASMLTAATSYTCRIRQESPRQSLLLWKHSAPQRFEAAAIVFRGDFLRHHHFPGVQYQVAHFALIQRGQARVDPVEAEVRLTGKHEFVWLRFNDNGAPFF